MALTFINEGSTPTYLCLSSDIVNGKISGASLVGKTVLATNTGNWYVINKDLTLSQYNLPTYEGMSMDAFSRARVSLPNTLFNSNFVYNLQEKTFHQVKSGGGSIDHAPLLSSAKLSVGVSDGDSAKLISKDYFNYVPAKSQLIATTQTIGNAVANVVKRVGYFDSGNGIFIEQNGTEDIAVVLRSSTSGSPVDNRAIKENWNIDKFDGTGASGINLDLSKGHILVIDFQWLGLGRVRVGFDIDGKILYAHEFLNANNLSVPYMQTGTLPICWEILNNGTSAGSEMYATCSAVLSEGGTVEPGAYTFSVSTPIPITATTSRTPLLAIRPKALFGGKINRITIFLDHYEALAGTNSVLFELIYNPTITVTGAWTSVSDYSAAEYHYDIDTISGGTVIEADFVGSSVQSRGGSSGRVRGNLPLVLDPLGQNPISLVLTARALSNTSDCNAVLAWFESN